MFLEPSPRGTSVAYVALSIVDLLLRPGLLRPRGRVRESGEAPREETREVPCRLPAVLGAPIGAVAAFLGVGGSAMTVPALRRAGHPMRAATALANPLTLAIALSRHPTVPDRHGPRPGPHTPASGRPGRPPRRRGAAPGHPARDRGAAAPPAPDAGPRLRLVVSRAARRRGGRDAARGLRRMSPPRDPGAAVRMPCAAA
ncbi:hypothetical protein AV521_03850 [Streptomyces sp. IMTB 2501]|nr:hypothetical protein AV521_03850 [Streptomyces sp. IMTB 2501]